MRWFEEFEYDPITKTFSPAWNRKKYIQNLIGYSEEFCHNVVRIIMRPNSDSTVHWFKESINWLNDAIGINLPVKKKPIWYLFAFILDENRKSFPIGRNLKFLQVRVQRELMYGQVVNSDLEYIKTKIIDLYESLDPTKVYSDLEVYKVYYDWYRSISHAKLEIKF